MVEPGIRVYGARQLVAMRLQGQFLQALRVSDQRGIRPGLYIEYDITLLCMLGVGS